jgi:competence protein CoiA
MKFAIVNGQRQEAQPGLPAECPGCGKPMVAKCGEVKVRHWAHKGRRDCDPWWENETEWHRAWKDQFPPDWQEIVHLAEDGERHIADVKTHDGWVIEFQHSHITPEERRSRDAFYPKLIWVVDGTRRKRDRTQFLRVWQEGAPIGRTGLVRSIFLDDCGLLREWAGSRSHIFFDIGEVESFWWLCANSPNGSAYVAQFPRTDFIAWHRLTGTDVARQFDALVNDIPTLIEDYESHRRAQQPRGAPLQHRRMRRHFRF